MKTEPTPLPEGWLDQRPEPDLAMMLPPEPRHESFMVLQTVLFWQQGREPCASAHGILILPRGRPPQHVLGQGPGKQRRRNGIFLRQSLCRRAQPAIIAPVKLRMMGANEAVRGFQIRPAHQKGECPGSIRMRRRMRDRPVLRLVEIRQAPRIDAQVIGAEPAQEHRPALILRLVLAPERIQRRDTQIDMPAFLMGTAGLPIQPSQCLGRTGMGDQPLSDITGKFSGRPPASTGTI